MNSYPGISPFIVALVKKHANALFWQFEQKIDLEDFQQELMIATIRSLEKFNPRLGFIEDFINRCLLTKSREIARNLRRQKRKTFLNTYQIETIQQCGIEQNIYASAEVNNLINLLPKGLQEKVTYLRHSNPTGSNLKIIKKILSAVVCLEGEKKKMKNISCIETLSVQELSRLSELDLHDLSEKISETHNWVKKLVEKFEMALTAKYAEEAKKKLHETGADFGTCKMKRNGFVVSVQLPKKVQWDQEILENLYNRLDPDVRKEIFKVNFSIDEKQFSKLSKIMTDAVSSARSTAYGKVKISISKADEVKL